MTEESLFTAVRYNDPDLVKLLLDEGLNVNAMSSRYGRTPLIQAVLSYKAEKLQSPEVVKLLLENGADTSIRSKGIAYPDMTALEIAESEKLDEVLDILSKENSR